MRFRPNSVEKNPTKTRQIWNMNKMYNCKDMERVEKDVTEQKRMFVEDLY
uniref:Uncharacterized protein n=1 Tax=Arion vulgaris TaxID=1028688 RepID=A0A0B7BRU9_9EUPU